MIYGITYIQTRELAKITADFVYQRLNKQARLPSQALLKERRQGSFNNNGIKMYMYIYIYIYNDNSTRY